MNPQEKKVEIEFVIPPTGYRRWIIATHFCVELAGEFRLVTFSFQPEGMGLLDSLTVVIVGRTIADQSDAMLKFLQQTDIPDGPSSVRKVAPTHPHKVDWVSASTGVGGAELAFLAVSANAMGQVVRGASRDRVKVTPEPVAVVQCSPILLRQFIKAVYVHSDERNAS